MHALFDVLADHQADRFSVIRNTYIDFSKMTAHAIVAIVHSIVFRDASGHVVGYAFTFQSDRYGQERLSFSRTFPRNRHS